MKLHANQFENPSEGIHSARLVEIKDLGLLTDAKGQKKHYVRFIWRVLDERDSEGRPMTASERFTTSIDPKSFLYKAIVDITGRGPEDDDETDDLIGTECDIVIKHAANNGKVWPNITGHFRNKRQTKPLKEAGAAIDPTETRQSGDAADSTQITDDDIPS